MSSTCHSCSGSSAAHSSASSPSLACNNGLSSENNYGGSNFNLSATSSANAQQVRMSSNVVGCCSGTCSSSCTLLTSAGGLSGSGGGIAKDQLRQLFEACKTGDINRVKQLATPRNVNSRDIIGRRSSPLHFASGYGRRDVVDYLLSLGACINSRDEGGLNPLHNAASFGHSDVVRTLLAKGAEPNARDNWNYTPLHESAAKGKIDVCIALLQNGGDATIRNSEGKTPFDLADPASTQSVFTGEYMKHQLLEASRSGNEERLLAYLTPFNVNCHAQDGRRSTCLHLSAGYNRLKIVQTILRHSGDVHARDKI